MKSQILTPNFSEKHVVHLYVLHVMAASGSISDFDWFRLCFAKLRLLNPYVCFDSPWYIRLKLDDISASLPPLRCPNLRRRWRAPWWDAKGETAHHPHGPKDVAPSSRSDVPNRCIDWISPPRDPASSRVTKQLVHGISKSLMKERFHTIYLKRRTIKQTRTHIHDTTEIHILASFVVAKSTAQGTEDKQSRTAGRLCSILQVQRTSETIRS